MGREQPVLPVRRVGSAWRGSGEDQKLCLAGDSGQLRGTCLCPRSPRPLICVWGLSPGTASPGGPATSPVGSFLAPTTPNDDAVGPEGFLPSSLLPSPSRPNESGKLRGHRGVIPSRKTSGPGAYCLAGTPREGGVAYHRDRAPVVSCSEWRQRPQISPSMGYKNGQYRGPPGRPRAEGVIWGQKVGKISPWCWPKFTLL
jgi:hypothetical protein